MCLALLIGLAYLRPELQEKGILKQQKAALTEAEITEERNKFLAENGQAKEWSAQVTELEGELSMLEDELTNSLFLQIDPERRINKHFTLRFTYFMVDFKDKAEKIRMNQMLCIHYMKQLSSDRYVNYLATKGLLKYSPSALTGLIDMTVNQDGYIEFTATAPEEVIIDQLIKTTRDYLERIVRPDIDPIATHFLNFGKTTKEVVKDPSITQLKNKIENEITTKKEKIGSLNQMINTAFEEFLNETTVEMTANNVPVKSSSKSSLIKNIALGFILGLIASALITIVRYNRQIIKTDTIAITQANNISHLGTVPYFSEEAKKRSKSLGSSVDKFFIRLFGLAHNVEEATNQANYVAQILIGMVDARTKNEEHPDAVNILIPYVKGDASAEALVICIRKALNQNGDGQQINLIEGGSLEYDPDTIKAARKSSGLLLLSKSSANVTTLINSIHRGADLSKEILGVLEMDERW